MPLILPETRAKTWQHNPYRKEFDRMRGVTFYPVNMPDWYHKLPPYHSAGSKGYRIKPSVPGVKEVAGLDSDRNGEHQFVTEGNV